MKNFLLIGGIDGTGGAGIMADFRITQALNLFPYFLTTARAVQNHTKLFGNFYSSAEEINQSLESIFNECEIEFIKIGMIGNTSIANTIINFLRNKNTKIILDTPLKTTSGFILQEEEAVMKMAKHSFLLTPNKEEYEVIKNYDFNCPILVKSFYKGVDRLFYNKEYYKDFTLPQLNINYNVRGTGCAFASAICGFLFLGNSLENAIGKAKNMIYNGIKNATFNGNAYFLNFAI